MNKILNNLNKIIIIISVAIFAYILLDLFVLDGRQLVKREVDNPIKEITDSNREPSNSDQETDNSDKETSEVLAENVKKIDADIFYWGSTCPYCHDVQEWMEENDVEEKIEILSKEVYNNEANSRELTARAESCGMDTQRIGVPFLYTLDGECLVGSPNIIEYLTDRIAQ